jgi:predicted TIM-barrel fold metal-dependent hydrolase
MITIQGLTHKQKVLMDVMWSMDDISTVTAFVKTLPTRDRQDCMSLITIATQETYEQEGGLDAYKELAVSVIASVSSR